jgi:uncharacterized protein (UPF0147 family)
MAVSIDERLRQIGILMDAVLEDTSVPRNIRKIVSDAKTRILSKGELDVSIASAIYMLDEISNDINMPFHARTDVWNVISELEKLKEEIKK